MFLLDYKFSFEKLIEDDLLLSLALFYSISLDFDIFSVLDFLNDWLDELVIAIALVLFKNWVFFQIFSFLYLKLFEKKNKK